MILELDCYIFALYQATTKVKHIVLIGPESTGKSTLAKQLSSYYDAELVKEYAREYLRNNGPDYNQQDLRAIAFGQFTAQLSAMKKGKDLVISDTCLLTVAIWEERKYGLVDEFILEWKSLQQIDCYLLCKPDLPWEADILRESEHELDVLFDIYEKEIKLSGIPFRIVSGEGDLRLENARLAVEDFVSSIV